MNSILEDEEPIGGAEVPLDARHKTLPAGSIAI